MFQQVLRAVCSRLSDVHVVHILLIPHDAVQKIHRAAECLPTNQIVRSPAGSASKINRNWNSLFSGITVHWGHSWYSPRTSLLRCDELLSTKKVVSKCGWAYPSPCCWNNNVRTHARPPTQRFSFRQWFQQSLLFPWECSYHKDKSELYLGRMNRLIDLSHTIENGMITYKGLPAPIICDYLSREDSKKFYEPGTEFQIGKIEMIVNTGTRGLPVSPLCRWSRLKWSGIGTFRWVEWPLVRADFKNGIEIGKSFWRLVPWRGRRFS